MWATHCRVGKLGAYSECGLPQQAAQSEGVVSIHRETTFHQAQCLWVVSREFHFPLPGPWKLCRKQWSGGSVLQNSSWAEPFSLLLLADI